MKKWILLLMFLVGCSTVPQNCPEPDATKPPVVEVPTKPEPTPTKPPVVVKPEPTPGKIDYKLAPFQIMHISSKSDMRSKLKPETRFLVLEYDQVKSSDYFEGMDHIVKIGYMSTSYEAWRADANQYPKEAKGKKMDGWDELWGDFTKESLKSFLMKRVKIAKSLGFDAIEWDNTDIAWNDVGFKVTAEANKEALLDICKRVHAEGMGIFLKNTTSLTEELSSCFDGALVEEADEYNEAHRYDPFSNKGKPVFRVEYGSSAKARTGHIVQRKSGYFSDSFKVIK